MMTMVTEESGGREGSDAPEIVGVSELRKPHLLSWPSERSLDVHPVARSLLVELDRLRSGHDARHLLAPCWSSTISLTAASSRASE